MDYSDSDEEFENDAHREVSDESRSESPEGWVDQKYKKFNACDDSSDSDSSDDESEDESEGKPQVRGKNVSGGGKQTYKKILEIEELLPE